MQTCRTCNYEAEDFTDLAKHIIARKIDHRKGLKWANAYLLKVNLLNQKKDLPEGRIALTEEQKEARENTQRALCGKLKAVSVTCLNCQSDGRDMLPIEYVDSPFAWKKNNKYVVSCSNCRR